MPSKLAPLPRLFSRVEIGLRAKGDLARAADELTELAGDLRALASRSDDDATLVILAFHKIRVASRKLRKTN